MRQQKNYLKKLNRIPVNPNPIEVMTFLVQCTFMGGYLNYMYVFVCGNSLAKTYCFLPSIGQLAMPHFFSAKYMFAMVPTKEYRKNLTETFTFTD